MGFFSDLLKSPLTGPGLLRGTKTVDSSAAANKYLDQIPGVAHENLDPYIMPGEQAQSFVDKIMKGYKPSEGYNFQREELGKGLSNTAAAGGYAGGEYDQSQRAKLIQGLLGSDMDNYFNKVMGVHNQSYGASSQLNDILGGALNQQGGMAFGQAENKNQGAMNLQNALMKLLGGAAGAALGGPAGASLGASLLGKSETNNTASGFGKESLFGGGNYGRGTVNAPRTNTFGSAFGGR